MSGERQERLELLRERQEKGEAFSRNYDRSHTVNELLELENEEELPESEVSTAGRIMEIRDFGDLVFLDLRGERADIQVMVEEESLVDQFQEIYRGDFIGVSGNLTYTDTGEYSIEAQEINLLTTSVRQLPSEHYGVQDPELRYSDRPLHLTVDMDARDVFRQRSKIISCLRSFLEERNYMEVETPVVQPVYGGANAEPFETHINDRDMDAYLRISPELYLKRLVVGGYERVFEVARNFRNESIDTTHNPEFTIVEIYQAYADYEDMMELTENLVEEIARNVIGTTEIEYRGQDIDLSSPWRRITMRDAIREYGGIEVSDLSDQELRHEMEERGIELDAEYKRGLAVAEIFEEVAEEELVQPTHVIDYPQETTPLCMSHRDKDGIIERFESFIAGMELANAYTELRNPEIQREHFEEEQRRQQQGDDEAHPIDIDFVESLELGMPPTGGLGIGVDRLVMVLTNQESIRDVLMFPMTNSER